MHTEKVLLKIKSLQYKEGAQLIKTMQNQQQ